MISGHSALLAVGVALTDSKLDAQGKYTQPSIIFQLILTVSFLAVGLYAIALRRKIPMLGNLALLVTMIAMVLVWRPDDATAVASLFKIGRGADLIFYCWVIISMMMILNLHLKMRIQSETVTEMVRQFAITQPFAVPERDVREPGAGDESSGAGST